MAALVIFLAFGSPPAWADRNAYDKVVDLSAESATLRVEHHHDWGVAQRDSDWERMSTGKDLAGSRSTLSYLRVLDKKSGAELFHRPVSALTYLWIDDKSTYVVGISRIKVGNPHQLVVFNRAGERLLERNLAGIAWPGKSESVTNWIQWYKEPVPKISIDEGTATALLSVQDPVGGMRRFEFHLTP
ncbi:hypothetical protein [Massilia antarctica]|uniref:hypothetical protein n=1 Tax=Massilia antarctica TaxID=2765360 RepID=UPI0006BB8111|nr:hypothetical protein [Massilia sp. H27-R4]MCY0913833.1 hypothetical protein [Massilia sp. H27-R4]CUI04439.1 hypothetical protein BN2497_3655 [Janthinobacterium sp. CG23_2]CUU28225.1 hypothetical protein BN3177_3655 [Janthinobacterium sp. CG23_2]